MSIKNIELVISEGIKNGKWIYISYKNNQNEITYYWIAIKDIDLKKRILYVSIFNDQKSLNSLDAIIKFSNLSFSHNNTSYIYYNILFGRTVCTP